MPAIFQHTGALIAAASMFLVVTEFAFGASFADRARKNPQRQGQAEKAPATPVPAAVPVASPPTATVPLPTAPVSNDDSRFQQEIWAPAESLIVGEGATTTLGVFVRNASRYVWPSKGANPVHLSYHWLNYRGEVEIYDGLRTSLPSDLRPQEAIFLMATVKAPQKLGRFILRMTLVQEGIAWFEDRGGIPADVYVDVISAK